MRRALYVIAVFALGGCDQVLGLARDTSCPYTALEPGDDADGDRVINSADACPLVPEQEAHDEDGDVLPDACDLCPNVGEAGVDRDCDGIGAACDLDDSVPHVREFFGFGSLRGIQLENTVTLAGDAVQFRFVGPSAYGAAMVLEPVAAAGSYEIHSTLTAIGNEYCQHGLVIDDAAPEAYQIVVFVHRGIANLAIRIRGSTDALVFKEAGQVAAGAELVLRLDIVGTTLTARLTGGGLGFTEITTTLPTLSDLVEYGASAYCDAATVATGIDVTSMTRTVLAP